MTEKELRPHNILKFKDFRKSNILKCIGWYLFFLLIILFSFSCKTRKNKQGSLKKDFSTDSVWIGFVAKQFNFETLEAKVNINTNIEGKTQSFNANLRLKRDSIIWVSVSPFLGIEVARMLITRDSVKVLNRLDNTYMLTDNNYLKSLINADIDFIMLQSVLVGNDFPHFEIQKFEILKNTQSFVLQANNRNRLRTVGSNSNMAINQTINIDLVSYKILRNYFSNTEQNYTFEAQYSSFLNLEGQQFAYKTESKINKDNKLWELNLEYTRINLNTNTSFPFSIPDKYTKMP